MSRHRDIVRELQRLGLITQATQNLFQLLYLRIGLTSLVPQIIFFHKPSINPSRSRSCFMPRCRLTRTDAAVRPVRAAISGPVMPRRVAALMSRDRLRADCGSTPEFL